MYTQKYVWKTAFRWECFNCAAITTDLEMKTATNSSPQTHDPYDTAVSATKLHITMLEHV